MMAVWLEVGGTMLWMLLESEWLARVYSSIIITSTRRRMRI